MLHEFIVDRNNTFTSHDMLQFSMLIRQVKSCDGLQFNMLLRNVKLGPVMHRKNRVASILGQIEDTPAQVSHLWSGGRHI